jgi:hypothetical protein
LLLQLATHLALGLEQIRLRDEARRHGERLLGLQRVAQRLASRAADEDLLDVVLDEAVRSVGGQTGTLLLWDQRRRALVTARDTAASTAGVTVVQPGEGLAAQAIRACRLCWTAAG